MSLVTQEIHGALDRYVRLGIETGGFLRAVLENDLFRAVGIADTRNKTRLVRIVEVIVAKLPPQSYGSPEAVRYWLSEGHKFFNAQCNSPPPD